MNKQIIQYEFLRGVSLRPIVGLLIMKQIGKSRKPNMNGFQKKDQIIGNSSPF
jgi:hypothetical protein